MTKTDLQMKQDIEEALRWDPKINAAQISVTVEKGAVTLLGGVDTYAEKWEAEEATRRVSGVRTIAQDLAVKLLTPHVRSDAELATAVQAALVWDIVVPREVTAAVENGKVTLGGHVTWHYQREAAERAVRNLAGVVAVYNFITLKAAASSDVVKEKVQAALQRQGNADAQSIQIATSGGKVTLTGHASSWQAIRDAAAAAWAAPGVTEVVDQLTMSQTN